MHYKLRRFGSLSSTQDKAKEFSRKGLSSIVIVADAQTKGKGRFKRKWFSSKDGLWFSILLKPDNAEKLQYLTFIAAIAVARSIKKFAKLDAKIKWPNDVHYEGKKLCGILTEGIFGKENHVIVGIGLNVNQDEFPDEIRNIATSLRIVKKKSFDKNKLLENILNEFFGLYGNFYCKGKFDVILKLWKKYSDTISKDVTIITTTKKISGKVVGVDEDCSLLLKLKNGNVAKIVEGDINVRY